MNAFGDLKLRALLIEKSNTRSNSPRAFKNHIVNCLPTMYANQRSRGWIVYLERIFTL